MHSDFDELKSSKEFLTWLEEQPKTIAEGIYKNSTDAKWAARVVDLYKADTGLNKPTKKRQASAADAVTRTPVRDVRTDSNSGKRTFKSSEIVKMKPWEFEQMESELDIARAEGRIDFNS